MPRSAVVDTSFLVSAFLFPAGVLGRVVALAEKGVLIPCAIYALDKPITTATQHRHAVDPIKSCKSCAIRVWQWATIAFERY